MNCIKSNLAFDPKIFIGQTNDIERRLSEHNDPNYKNTLYTKRHKGPWRLLWAEDYGNRCESMKREKELKTENWRDWIKKELMK